MAGDAPVVLRARDLTVRRGPATLLAPSSFELHEGERVLLLVGRSHSPSVHAPDDERGPTEALLCGAERALPGIRSRIEASCLYRTARPRFDVGHYRAVASLRREQARRLGTRRIALAGDYLVGPDLESAARSGFRAADDIETALA